MSSDNASSEPGTFEPAHFSVLAQTPSGQRAFSASQTHGYATGYAQGIRAAESTARAQREALARAAAASEAARAAEHAAGIEALRAAAAALHARTVPVLDQATEVLVESALQLAEKIVGKELSNEHFGARAALERAMQGNEVNTVREVRMNPRDLNLLELTTIPGTGIALVPDASVNRGDALTAFDEGFIDARISTAFERACAALRGEGA